MEWTDDAFLRHEAYRRPEKLRARQSLHARFGSNPQPWFSWVFERLELDAGARVLEVGCGPGDLWQENLRRLPEGVRVTLADLSPGMAAQAARVPGAGQRETFGFLAADVQRLPFPDGSYDLVVANHMLYHVADLAAGLREVQRVLAPGGRLCATTNGRGNLQELCALAGQRPGESTMEQVAERFGLETAGSRLAERFTEVEVLAYPDELWVTEAQPLLDYIQSMFRAGEGPSDLEGLRKQIEGVIRAEGGLRITKSNGMLRGRRK